MDGTAGQAVEYRLYGLMEVAERQQASAQATLEGLAAERAALAREREALARGVAGLQAGMQGAVRAAVAESLAGAATEGVAAVQAATGPLLSRLSGVTAQAREADAALRGVVAWASWRLLGWLVAVGAAMVVLGWLMSSGVLWWTQGRSRQHERRRHSYRQRWQRCGPTGTSGPRRGCWASWPGATLATGPAYGWTRRRGRLGTEATTGCCWGTRATGTRRAGLGTDKGAGCGRENRA